MYASVLKPPYILFRRLFRRAYWQLKTLDEENIFDRFANDPEEKAWAKLVNSLPAGTPFSLVEGGCQNGRILYMLAKRFPESNFTGYDLNPRAIKIGNSHAGKPEKVSLHYADMLSVMESPCPDYFYACASLIYLNISELKTLLQWLEEGGCKGIVFCEPSSDNGKLIKTHIYMHYYEDILAELDAYSFSVESFKYSPWEGEGYKPKIFSLFKKT